MIPAKVRVIVDARDGFVCLRCKTYCRWWLSRHHRKPKGMGGSKFYDTPQNIVTLCGSGTTGCHGWVEAHREECYELGWLVRRNSLDDPATIPVPSYRGLILLTADGGYTPVEEPAEVFDV